MGENMEGVNIQVEAKTADTIPRLWDGDHSGVYDGALEADAQGGSRN